MIGKKLFVAVFAAATVAVMSVAGASAAGGYTCNFESERIWTDECQANVLAITAETYETQGNWQAAADTWRRYSEMIERINEYGESTPASSPADNFIYIGLDQPVPAAAIDI